MPLRLVPDRPARPFACILCGARWATKKELGEHLAAQHSTTIEAVKGIRASTTGLQGPPKKEG